MHYNEYKQKIDYLIDLHKEERIKNKEKFATLFMEKFDCELNNQLEKLDNDKLRVFAQDERVSEHVTIPAYVSYDIIDPVNTLDQLRDLAEILNMRLENLGWFCVTRVKEFHEPLSKNDKHSTTLEIILFPSCDSKEDKEG